MANLSDLDDLVFDYVASVYAHEINCEICDGVFQSDWVPDRCYVEAYIDQQTNSWLLRQIAGAFLT